MRNLDLSRPRFLFRGVAAVLAAAFIYFLTGVLPYYPASWRLLLMLVVAVVWFFHPRWGTVLALAALILPVAYNFSVAQQDRGIVLALVALAALVGMLLLQPFPFLVLAGGVVTFVVPSLRGLLLFIPLALAFQGAARGAITGAVAAFWTELLMVLTGRPTIGVVATGTPAVPLVVPQAAPVKSLLDYRWLAPPPGATPAASVTPGDTPTTDATPVATPVATATPAASTHALHPAAGTHLITLDVATRTLTPFVEHPQLLAEIGLWALAAGVTGALIFRTQLRRLPPKVPAFLPSAAESVRAFLDRPLLRSVPARALALGAGATTLIAGQVAVTATLAQSRPEIAATAVAALVPAALVWLAAPLLEVAPNALAPGQAIPQRTLAAPLSVGRAAEAAPPPKSARREIPKDTWSDLAGVAGIQQELVEAIESQFNPRTRELLRRLSLRPTRGILLFGPPGTGKTKLARVIAHEAGAAFFAVSGTEFTSKWVGESEANLRRIFTEARESRPSVLFFDELEAFLPKRSEMSRSDAHEKGIIGTFLSYTDGVGDLDGVLLVGATNYPNLIDPAALRPGRFDKLIYVSAPDLAGRREIFARYLADKPLAPEVDIEKLAERTERFTGADIQSVCEQATRRALARGGNAPDPLTMADLETVIRGTKPSVTFKMLSEYQAMADQFSRRSEQAEVVDVVARPRLTWDDVAGLQEVKDALREAIELPLTHPELFKEYGIKPSKGVLLFGPPGCGKTFLAKVVASQARAHFLQVKGPELLQQYVGGSESQLREVFLRARENTPCVLFFDEIDALAGARGTADASHTQILTQFLTEMDGVDELKGVVVVAATNRPDTLDSALLRPGRLDRILYIPPPDRPARKDLIEKTLASKPLDEGIDYDALAELTEGYSSADIAAICNAAALNAARESLRSGDRHVITTAALQAQIASTPRSISEADMREFERLRDQMQR